MRPAPNLIATVAILLAGALAFLSANWAANLIERRAAAEVWRALSLDGIDWAMVEADGLQVRLQGTAPTEAARFHAITVAGTIIDAERLIDEVEIPPAKPIAPPRFSLELLRNDSGISMIGLIPAQSERDKISAAVQGAAGQTDVTDMLETADYSAPDGWQRALDFGLKAVARLPRSKISIAADKVSITAISDSPAEKKKLEAALAKDRPKGLNVAIDISAPRPVITPFTLRFVIDADGPRFDACSADTEDARSRILAAAERAGMAQPAQCSIGLGVPSPNWAKAVETGIQTLTDLGGGTLTFSDADVTLIALETTPQGTFDTEVGELEADLPGVFSLHAVLPEPVKIDGTGEGDGPPEFVATRSPEGQVQLRGRVPDQLVRTATESYARSRFGFASVYGAMRLDETLPDGWPLRVLAALEGLSHLNNGSVVVQPSYVELRGQTGDAGANAEIARLFGEKLGDAQNFDIDVTYVEALDPIAGLPTPEECVASVNAILAEQKITFAPGSTTVEGDALKVVDRIAEALKECGDVQIEIGGHTDSQGREEMNQQLSQQRAQAVLNALLSRRIRTANLSAKGYGETVPLADNKTEDGREANRRIEFKLILPEDSAENTDAEPPQQPEATDEQN